ncbi:MAG: transcription initiation factor IIB [Candidatus Odinarchaeia archaeon]
MVLENSSDKSDFRECASCGAEDLKRFGNQVICSNCGLVLSTEYCNDIKNNSREGDRTDSSMQKHYPKIVLQNGIVENWWDSVKVSDSTDYNLAQGFAEITRIGLKLDLPLELLKDSARLYQKLAKKKTFKGLSISSLASAVIYISCKKEHYLLSIDKIAKVLDINKKEISNSYKFVIKSLNLKTSAISPIQYLQTFCNKMSISDINKIIIEKILKAANEVKIISGKNPVGIIAAAIYISSLITDDKITQRELSEISFVTQTTIRTRYKELLQNIDIFISI